MIMISGHGDVATAVDAVKRGAIDFIEKPLDQNRVLVSINNALREGRLEAENSGLRRQLGDRWRLIGESEAMRTLREQVERVAASEASVLITGENGTGKEVVARSIHIHSSRSSGPYVTVNCAAIPGRADRIGAVRPRKGQLHGGRQATHRPLRVGPFGGTLLLDEVGDMPLAAQAKVLRALETREITRVGGTETRSRSTSA